MSRHEEYYDSDKLASPAIQELIKLYEYRDSVWLITKGILKHRYKRSILGVFWMFLNPLLYAIVFTIAFSTLFQRTLPYYPLYLLTGLIAWHMIFQTTSFAMMRMAYGGGLLKKIYVPRSIYVVASLGNGLINLLISILIVLAISLLLGMPLSYTLLFLPISIVMLFAFTLGLSLLMATMATFFSDTVDVFQVLMQAIFFLSAIIYPPSTIPEKWQFVLNINPFYYMIEIFRTPFYYQAIPDFNQILVVFAVSASTLIIGWYVFTINAEKLVRNL